MHVKTQPLTSAARALSQWMSFDRFFSANGHFSTHRWGTLIFTATSLYGKITAIASRAFNQLDVLIAFHQLCLLVLVVPIVSITLLVLRVTRRNSSCFQSVDIAVSGNVGIFFYTPVDLAINIYVYTCIYIYTGCA